MRTNVGRFAVLIASASVLGLSACGHPDQHDALRAEINAVRELATSADQKATAAQAEAQQAATAADQAAQEARTASEKADQIFRANLRK